MTPTRIDLPPTEGISTDLQDALNRARDRPVHVSLMPGRHLSGPLKLYSNTVLELAEGADLVFAPGYELYASNTVGIVAEQSDRALISAIGAERVELRGAGRILCDGSSAYTRGDDDVMGTRIPVALRPRVLVMDHCWDVSLSGLTICDSPMWTLHFVDCEGLRIAGLTIDNDRRMPNTDGIVIDGCRDVEITSCQIRTADDGVVLKTSHRVGGGTAGECRAVSVTHCVIESRSCALKIGTESAAPFADIRFEDCRIEASNRALGIFSRDGGTVENVRFARIALECKETPDGFWGSGEPVTITALDRRETPAGAVTGIEIADVTGRAPGAINLYAQRQGLISDVVIRDVALVQEPGDLGTSRAYDLRPTPADLIPSDDAAGRINAWRLGPDGRVIGLQDYPGGVPAVFAHGVEGLRLSGLDVTRPEPLPEGWAVEPVTEELVS